MKKLALVLFSFSLFSLFVFPSRAHAQLCADQDGHCVWSSTCVYGPPISSSDCNIPMFLCCPNNPVTGTTCQEQGGHCAFTGTCANGSPISAFDCTFPGFLCCPDAGSSVSTTGEVWCSSTPGVVSTALGCIDVTSPSGFLSPFLRWAIGISSVVALMVFVYAGVLIISSSGNPKQVKAGQELMIAAIWGVIVIALSVILLNFIGVRILNLSGLGFSI